MAGAGDDCVCAVPVPAASVTDGAGAAEFSGGAVSQRALVGTGPYCRDLPR